MSTRKETQIQSVLGIPITLLSPSEALSEILGNSCSDVPRDVHFVNSYTVHLCQNDSAYINTINSSWMNLMDGKPISWVARQLLRISEAEQVRGPEMFRAALMETNQPDASHYFIGGTTEVRDRLLQFIAKDNPGLNVAGFDCPPFRDLSLEELLERDASVRKSGATIVWLGLGTPKQDFEAQRLASTTGTTVIAVGAAFDFLSGTKKEAPNWMRSMGLEWAFRLITEPRRLWRRYVFGNLSFVWVTIRHLFWSRK